MEGIFPSTVEGMLSSTIEGISWGLLILWNVVIDDRLATASTYETNMFVATATLDI
jgi:hypothetical protein